jgi:hypothetical protein
VFVTHVESAGQLANACHLTESLRAFGGAHQTALTGSVLHKLQSREMVELSNRYNHPIFFERQYGATRPFHSIANAATIRCVVSREQMGPDWAA